MLLSRTGLVAIMLAAWQGSLCAQKTYHQLSEIHGLSREFLATRPPVQMRAKLTLYEPEHYITIIQQGGLASYMPANSESVAALKTKLQIGDEIEIFGHAENGSFCSDYQSGPCRTDCARAAGGPSSYCGVGTCCGYI